MANWKTTLAGIIAGLGPTLDALSSALNGNQPVHWLSLLTGLGIMVLGVLAKDANRAQP